MIPSSLPRAVRCLDDVRAAGVAVAEGRVGAPDAEVPGGEAATAVEGVAGGRRVDLEGGLDQRVRVGGAVVAGVRDVGRGRAPPGRPVPCAHAQGRVLEGVVGECDRRRRRAVGQEQERRVAGERRRVVRRVDDDARDVEPLAGALVEADLLGGGVDRVGGDLLRRPLGGDAVGGGEDQGRRDHRAAAEVAVVGGGSQRDDELPPVVGGDRAVDDPGVPGVAVDDGLLGGGLGGRGDCQRQGGGGGDVTSGADDGAGGHWDPPRSSFGVI